MKNQDVTKAAKQLGRLGGIARAKKLTATQRRTIARKAAHARWKRVASSN